MVIEGAEIDPIPAFLEEGVDGAEVGEGVRGGVEEEACDDCVLRLGPGGGGGVEGEVEEVAEFEGEGGGGGKEGEEEGEEEEDCCSLFLWV